MRLNNIKLVDLLPLREEEKEDENPFAAAAEEKPSEEGEEDSGGDKKSDDKKSDDKKPAASQTSNKPKIKFNISAVKRYNSAAKFLGTEGEIISADKSGMEVNVVPDNVQIHVNYQDII